MKNRVRTQGKLGHQRRQHSGNSTNAAISSDNKPQPAQQRISQLQNYPASIDITPIIGITQPINSYPVHQPSTELQIDTANNNQLKQIISKLIIKSRSLIESLEKTLKELDLVRGEKEFWKGHYLRFKTACERYVRSRGIEPFQYTSYIDGGVERTDSGCGRLYQQQQLNQSHYRSSSLNHSSNNNYKPVGFYFNNTLTTSPVRENKEVFNLSGNSNKIPSLEKHPSQTKQQTIESPSTMIKTVIKTLDEDKTLSPQDHTIQKFDNSFKGIKLGKGKNNAQRKKSPLKLRIYDTRGKNNSNYRRKDSLQTKKVELFSFVRNRNNDTHESFHSVQMKVS